jgi:hypothetical protein
VRSRRSAFGAKAPGSRPFTTARMRPAGTAPTATKRSTAAWQTLVDSVASGSVKRYASSIATPALGEVVGRGHEDRHRRERSRHAREQVGVHHVAVHHVGAPGAHGPREAHHAAGIGHAAAHAEAGEIDAELAQVVLVGLRVAHADHVHRAPAPGQLASEEEHLGLGATPHERGGDEHDARPRAGAHHAPTASR